MTYLLKPAMVLTPSKVLIDTYIYFDNERGKIISLTATADLPFSKEISFTTPVIVVPGLINIHDHLLGTYWPRVARGPHLHWKFWDDALKSSRLYKERSNIPKEDIYLLGAYKNMLSGVTTVMDHFPHKFNEDIIPTLPISVPSEYCLSHEVSSFELSWWGDGVKIESSRAIQNNWPYVTHIEEGFDEESMRGVDQLIEANALNDHAVLVHGIGLSDKDIEKIAEAKAHAVWCPSSNMFLYDTTAKIKEWIDAGINVSLGTDSPMSGSINLFAELKFAAEIYESIYGQKISDEKLLEMITVNPAKALRIDDKVGQVVEGFDADLLILKLEDFENPYANVRLSDTEDIEMVIRKGNPILYKSKYSHLFDDDFNEKQQEVSIKEIDYKITGDLKGLMQRIHFNVGFKKFLPFIPIS
jgi:5-methylthioadenosine/S-adenosylhomocysteine deaminase